MHYLLNLINNSIVDTPGTYILDNDTTYRMGVTNHVKTKMQISGKKTPQISSSSEQLHDRLNIRQHMRIKRDL